jgi:hypothetical protein
MSREGSKKNEHMASEDRYSRQTLFEGIGEEG